MGMAAPVMAGLALATAAVQIAGSAAESSADKKVAKANRDAAMTVADLNQKHAEDAASASASDVVRSARKTLSTSRVAALAMGASPGAMARIAAEVGGAEGLSVSRIDKNLDADLKGIELDRLNARNTYSAAKTAANNRLVSSVWDASLNAAGSIYGSHVQETAWAEQKALAQNRNPGIKIPTG